ncbi:MAG: Rrf2 family transcriptional regulator [Chitinivibrionales bacterium]|nr:Rrf2 family transcriptional regulator [Chitinivibrionales bacterium]MBD3397184.1 Rrf2 family transcriptional regulator [Chitinivibrionales bacterium]
MKLSTRCRYGSRALVEIGRNYGHGPTKRKDICKNQELSDSYLENILIALKTAGILDTIRGARGGYVLCRPPSRVTMYDIAIALEGSQAAVECLDNDAMCSRTGACATQDVWRAVRLAEERILKETTVEDLVTREKRYSRKRGARANGHRRTRRGAAA